jgi:uncharacterized protein YhfF
MGRPDDAPAPGDKDAIEVLWLEYQRACQVKVEGFAAAPLGSSRILADERALLVMQGVKRAHATLRREFEKDLEPLPAVGEHLVVLDGAGQPRAIVRNTHVELRRFCDSDDEFACAAGEGDLTLRWWLTAHRQEWSEQAEREGFEIGETSELVLEFFDCVWPQPQTLGPPSQ